MHLKTLVPGKSAAPAVLFIGVVLFSYPADAQTLRREPPPGALRFGDRVLVDDGRCPRGQVKEVTGGSNIGGSETRAGRAKRNRRCIPR